MPSDRASTLSLSEFCPVEVCVLLRDRPRLPFRPEVELVTEKGGEVYCGPVDGGGLGWCSPAAFRFLGESL